MQLYPIFMDLSASRCLIVGAGGVGVRKLESLLRARPLEILVVDPSPAPACLQLATHPRVVLAKRMFMPDDCNDRTLVFAATGNRKVNAAVAACCAKRGILCNIADNKEESSFIVPACIEHKNLSLAISTHGGSPALSRRIRKELEIWLDDRYDGISELLTRLRPLVLALHRETGQNTDLFRSIVYSPLAEALQQRDRNQCETLLRALLPKELHPNIMELLHDLV